MAGRAMAGMSLINTVWGVFGTMTAIIVVWFILENSILDSYGRYTFTPYPGERHLTHEKRY
jgi:hypothetical protein